MTTARVSGPALRDAATKIQPPAVRQRPGEQLRSVSALLGECPPRRFITLPGGRNAGLDVGINVGSELTYLQIHFLFSYLKS
jgi:hypothetical protein